MSLSTNLLQELQAIAGQVGQSISLSEGQRTVRCEVDRSEPLAVTLTELSLQTPELANVTLAQLEAASRDLTAHVNYLLEPIAPIETDSEGCTVQMRSNPPQKDDNGYRYYELLLRRGGSASLRRYEKQAGQPRLPVPAVLTHEVVGRLIDDFGKTVDTI